MKIFFISITFLITLLISSCNLFKPLSSNISLTTTQYNCVLPSDYTAKNLNVPATIVNNPVNSPYCLQVTINNNSNKSKLSIETNFGGLVLNFYNNNGNIPLNSGILCDSNLYNDDSNNPCNNNPDYPNFVSSVANISFYDPYQCATPAIDGRSENFIAPNHKCSFFLQINKEAYDINNYRVVLNYQYRDGISNKSATVNLLEKVSLVVGNEKGLFKVNAYSNQQIDPIDTDPTIIVQKIVRDANGNIIVASNNGLYFLQLTKNSINNTAEQNNLIPISGLTGSISDLAVDGNTNIIYALKNNNIYINPLNQLVGTNTPWANITFIGTPIVGDIDHIATISVNKQRILVINNNNNLYYCTDDISTDGTYDNKFNCKSIVPATLNKNDMITAVNLTPDASIFLTTNNINVSNIYLYSPLNGWVNNDKPFAFNTPTQDKFTNIALAGNNILISALSDSNSLWICQINNYSCKAFTDLPLNNKNGNFLTGDAYNLLSYVDSNDGQYHFYVLGNLLASNSFSGGVYVNRNIATFSMNSNGNATSLFFPIDFTSNNITSYTPFSTGVFGSELLINGDAN